MLKKNNSNCELCHELNFYDSKIIDFFRKKGFENRALFENNNFVIIPSLGPVENCHLLLLPKFHINSFALMEKDLLKEAELIISKSSKLIREIYGNCIIFEHGVISERDGGSSSCSHAHMHIISCDKELKIFLEADGLLLNKIDSIEELFNKIENAYFYYRNNNDESWIMKDTIKKSQYVRKLISKLNGTEEKGLWQENINEEEMIKIFSRLKEENFNEKLKKQI